MTQPWTPEQFQEYMTASGVDLSKATLRNLDDFWYWETRETRNGRGYVEANGVTRKGHGYWVSIGDDRIPLDVLEDGYRLVRDERSKEHDRE